jgi:metal-responsive CopG/Arc/MetJ family transcriptional regulator
MNGVSGYQKQGERMFDVAGKLITLRVDDRLLERIDAVVAEDRQRDGEPSIRRSNTIRRLLREGLAARSKPEAK